MELSVAEEGEVIGWASIGEDMSDGLHSFGAASLSGRLQNLERQHHSRKLEWAN